MSFFGFNKKKEKPSTVKIKEVVLSNGQQLHVQFEIDCLGDSCPRPQLMTKKAIGKAIPMDVIEVAIDNPTSMEALPPMCPGLNATHLETIKMENYWNVYIRKN